STAVLCTGGRTEKAAMALRPGLPEVCFVEVGDFTGAALRRVAEHHVPEVVFVGMAGKLAKLAGGVLMTHYTRSRVPHALLSEITVAAGGGADLAARVEAANTARHAAELWDEAGLLGAAATELCSRVAEVLARFLADAATKASEGAGPAAPGDGPAGPAAPMTSIQVIMVDFAGRAQIGASPEVPAPPAPSVPPGAPPAAGAPPAPGAPA
ncbi:MAG TPA: cobalt-precorrin-5B (C(1))-methyltransferase, partial [Streptosporangiaceae bacterium]